MTREEFAPYIEVSQKAFRRFLVALCCGDSQLADDIAQESYIRAFMSCDRLQDSAKFQAWLFRIGYNTFVNSRRALKLYSDYDEARNIADIASADESFEYQSLYYALDKLPSKERTVVLLFYMQGYAIKEIAEIVDSSVDAVKQSLSRARNHLREMLVK